MLSLSDSSPENHAVYTTENTIGLETQYMTISQYTGKVNFTVLDSTNKLLAGTFEFDAVDKKTGQVIKITNGRFDIDQKTLIMKKTLIIVLLLHISLVVFTQKSYKD